MTLLTRIALARPAASLLAGALAAGLLALAAPVGASAALMTFGSQLSGPAGLNTTQNLNYVGTFTPVLPNPEAPNGVYHTQHWAADTALWNVQVAGGEAKAPASGQAVKINLEGCAEAADSGPRPLTQIHFQDLTPLPEGGAHVNITSQAFNIPVCGQNGASGSTVTEYAPIGLCVSQGDYIDFNDEGGYVPLVYRAGVPYQVLGQAQGSTVDSFIRNNGTDTGATFSSGDTTENDGFASNANEELMMQVTLGTGPNAKVKCGGTSDALPPIRISHQTDGINAQRVVAVAVYCRPATGCNGTATLSFGGHQASVGNDEFSLAGDTTGHVPIRLAPRLLGLIRKDNGIDATLTAVVDGNTFTQTIAVKIL
jgi:hypothetical protein